VSDPARVAEQRRPRTRHGIGDTPRGGIAVPDSRAHRSRLASRRRPAKRGFDEEVVQEVFHSWIGRPGDRAESPIKSAP
jgi:hypothetical protein